MGNSQQPSLGGRSWLAIVAGMLGVVAGMYLAWLVLSQAGLDGFWPGVIGAAVGAGLGAVLGQFAGSRLFPRPPGNGPLA